MRLLNIKTRQLEEFFGENIPPYGILSHCWSKEEVLFRDLAREDHKEKHGYKKIEGCCQLAAQENLAFVWIDTCCIDKSSSAELSEAINSMFRWYEQAAICYAYLEDVPPGDDPFSKDSVFRGSRWFTRGWTLQELLAPAEVKFYDCQWNMILRKSIDDCYLLREITHIPLFILTKHDSLSSVPAACKFSWAAARHTTRSEDVAYSLLGLLGINMPLLYGEGDRAFVRLQEALIGRSGDISTLTWGLKFPWEAMERKKIGLAGGVFAKSPVAFLNYPCERYRSRIRSPRKHSTITGHGLHVELPLRLVDRKNRVWIAIIEEIERVGTRLWKESGIVIVLRQQENKSNIFERGRGCPPIRIEWYFSRQAWYSAFSPKMIFIRDGDFHTPFEAMSPFSDRGLFCNLMRGLCGQKYGLTFTPTYVRVNIQQVLSAGFSLSSIYPPVLEDYMGGSIDCAGEPNGVSYIDESHGVSDVNCIAPSISTFSFYFVFSHKNNLTIKFVMRINMENLKYEGNLSEAAGLGIRSLCVQFFQCHLLHCATAIQYALKVDSWGEGDKHLGKKTKWQDGFEYKCPGKQETCRVGASAKQWKFGKMKRVEDRPTSAECQLTFSRTLDG